MQLRERRARRKARDATDGFAQSLAGAARLELRRACLAAWPASVRQEVSPPARFFFAPFLYLLDQSPAHQQEKATTPAALAAAWWRRALGVEAGAKRADQ